MLRHGRLVARAHHDPEPEIGETLCEQALRGAHQEDRLFQPVTAVHEPDLLRRVLGVMAGICLVPRPGAATKARARADRC